MALRALTLSSCHPITLSPYHPIVLSSYHPITLSPYHPIVLSPYHPIRRVADNSGFRGFVQQPINFAARFHNHSTPQRLGQRVGIQAAHSTYTSVTKLLHDIDGRRLAAMYARACHSNAGRRQLCAVRDLYPCWPCHGSCQRCSS